MKKTGLKRQDGDKFYTKKLVVDECMKAVLEKIDLDGLLVIEPSAGDGAFIDAIKQSAALHKFYDIEPHHPDIIKCDFLETDISDDTNSICFIGNPPFGRQSSLAIKFIKKCCMIRKKNCMIWKKRGNTRCMIWKTNCMIWKNMQKNVLHGLEKTHDLKNMQKKVLHDLEKNCMVWKKC